MKITESNKIFLALLLLFLLSCNNEASLEKIWVSKKWTQKLDSKKLREFEISFFEDKENSKERFKEIVDDLYTNEIADKLILNIFGDSLQHIHFNHTRYEGFTKYNLEYFVKSDSLFYVRDSLSESVYKIEFMNKNKMILSNYQDVAFLQENEVVFYPIQRFSPKEDIEYVKSIINEGDFKIGSSLAKIHFTESSQYCGKIVVEDINTQIIVGNDDFWCLSKIDSEIILQIGTEIIQIIAVNKKGIEGLIHGVENRKIFFNYLEDHQFDK